MTTSTSTVPALRLRAGDYAASVSPTGAGLCSLAWRGQDLILPYSPPAEPWRGQGELLLPWPNRIDGGRYTFQGREHRLEISEAKFGNAIHGLTRHAAWTTEHAAEERVVLRHRLAPAPGYPWRLDLAVTYRLSGTDGLTVEITATNADESALPYGNGAHPYLTVGRPIDDAVLQLPVDHWQPADGRMLPSGPALPVAGTERDFRTPRRIGATALDTAFTGVADRDAEGRAWASLIGDEAGVALWFDAACTWLQVFTAESPGDALHRRGVAVEPMTCPPNAFASGRDVIVLEPGESITTSHGIKRLGH